MHSKPGLKFIQKASQQRRVDASRVLFRAPSGDAVDGADVITGVGEGDGAHG